MPKTNKLNYFIEARLKHIILRHKFLPHRSVAVRSSPESVPRIQQQFLKKPTLFLEEFFEPQTLTHLYE